MNEIKDIATPKRTREIMERHGLTVKKSLGQNFLIEPNILTRMLEESIKQPTSLKSDQGLVH